MPSREEVEHSRKTGEPLCITIIEKCVLCDRAELGEIMQLKIPEGVMICDRCSKKYPDPNIYTGMAGGRAMFKVGYGILDEYGNVL